MKYHPLGIIFILFLLFLFACGEIGEEDDSNPNPSSGSEDPVTPGSSSSGLPSGSSSSGEQVDVCSGQFCCNGSEFDNTKNFCHENQLYPRCGGLDYDPYERGCFEGNLYPNCTHEKTRGTCVYESLLRCRQEGSGNDKIIKPLPGMKCEDNGKITGITVDLYDSKREYKIVQIGNQIWMAENLKQAPSELPVVFHSECYAEDDENCKEYGRLYDWATTMGLPPECNGTDQNCPPNRSDALWGGLCPPAFGVARTEDWDVLIEYAGGAAVAGGRLKSTSGWSNNGNGTDSYGFNALPSGYYTALMPTLYNEKGSRAMWWTDKQKTSEADYATIIASDTEVKINFQQKGFYMANVRCLHYF